MRMSSTLVPMRLRSFMLILSSVWNPKPWYVSALREDYNMDKLMELEVQYLPL